MAKPVTQKNVQAPVAATAPQAAAPAAKAKGKPTGWRKLGAQVERAQRVIGKATRIVGALSAETVASVQGFRGTTGHDLLGQLIILDAERIPMPKRAAPPKFEVNAIVRVAKKFLPKYVKDGLYTKEGLGAMEVVKVSENGKSFLCMTNDDHALVIKIATYKHLELVIAEVAAILKKGA